MFCAAQLNNVPRQIGCFAVEFEFDRRVILRHHAHALELACTANHTVDTLRVRVLKPVFALAAKSALVQRHNDCIGDAARHTKLFDEETLRFRVAHVRADFETSI